MVAGVNGIQIASHWMPSSLPCTWVLVTSSEAGGTHAPFLHLLSTPVSMVGLMKPGGDSGFKVQVKNSFVWFCSKLSSTMPSLLQ